MQQKTPQKTPIVVYLYVAFVGLGTIQQILLAFSLLAALFLSKTEPASSVVLVLFLLFLIGLSGAIIGGGALWSLFKQPDWAYKIQFIFLGLVASWGVVTRDLSPIAFALFLLLFLVTSSSLKKYLQKDAPSRQKKKEKKNKS